MFAFNYAKEEGFKAAKSGLNKWDNPYDYRFEAIQAAGWDEGFKEASK